MFYRIIVCRPFVGTDQLQVRNGTERCLHHHCTLQSRIVTMVTNLAMVTNGTLVVLLFKTPLAKVFMYRVGSAERHKSKSGARTNGVELTILHCEDNEMVTTRKRSVHVSYIQSTR